MALIQLAPPYPVFTDKNGDPLDNGYLYFGVVDLNPETNPIQVYYDSTFTQPVAQPIRTSNGYPMRNGAPALIFAGSQFSVTVRDKNSDLVIYSPVGYGVDPGSIAGVVVVQDHTGDGVTTAFGMGASPSSENATNAYIDGVYQSKAGYSISGSTLTFSEAPPLYSAIEIVSNQTAIIGGTDAGLVSYNEGDTGAVDRTVKAKLQETVSVKDFGAVGDGVTDDTAAIQAALNIGGSIVFSNTVSNTYLISDTLTIGSNTALIFADVATLKMAAATNKKMLINKDATNTAIAIHGGIFDINEANQTIQTPCIRFDNVDNSYFERVEIKPTHFQAYVGEGAWHFQDCDNNVIRNCTLKGSADEGLYLVGDDNKVLGGEYSDCANGSGIQQGGNRCLIDGVTAKNNTGSSLGLSAGYDSKIINCLVIGGGSIGAQAIRAGHTPSGCYGAILSGNTVRGWLGSIGIGSTAGSIGTIISNNNVEDMTLLSNTGIAAGDNARDTIIIGNRVTNCYTGIGGGQECVVTDNLVELCTYNGINIVAAQGSVISNNISRNNGNFGINLDNTSTNNTVSGNQVYDNADVDGIFTINTVAGGTLTLAGALVTGTVATMTNARKIGILSSGNDTGITFTVTGTASDGTALVDVITGVNAATASSVQKFKTVTSIVASGAAAANVTIGELVMQQRGIYLNADDNMIINNFMHGNAVTAYSAATNNDVLGNRCVLSEVLTKSVTLVAGAGGTTVTSLNIIAGSRLIIEASSSGTPARNPYLVSQGLGTCVIGALAGGASDTVKLYIN